MGLKSAFMGDPGSFAIEYELDTNFSMDLMRQPDKEIARRQWEDLKRTLETHNVRVAMIPSVPGLPDFTFVANAGLVLPWEHTMILSNFHHTERQPETPHLRNYFQNRFDLITLDPGETFEGEGDAFFWQNDVAFIPYGIRTNLAGAMAVAKIIKRIHPAVRTELLEMKFAVLGGPQGERSLYHRDMCLLPMEAKKIFFLYDPSFTETAIATLRRYGEVGKATYRQAYNFLCNGIEISSTDLIVSWADQKTRDQLIVGCGYGNPIVCRTEEFHKSGGGPACLRLTNPYSIG